MLRVSLELFTALYLEAYIMAEDPRRAKDNFLIPRSSYWGKPTLPNLTFNANLQEFAQRVSYVCNLETGGKMTAEEAYTEIKALWKQLKNSKLVPKIFPAVTRAKGDRTSLITPDSASH